MASTIQEALRPLLIAYFIMGVGIYPVKQEKRKCQWIIYISILYSLAVWFVYSYVLYYAIVFFTPAVLFSSTTVIVHAYIHILSTITSVIMSFCYQKKLIIYIKKLAMIDNTLEELGTPRKYSKFHILSKVVVIGLIVHSLIILLYKTIIWMKRKIVFWELLLIYVVNHATYVNTLIDTLFMYLLWYIGTQYDMVNKHMRCLMVKERNWFRYTLETYLPAFHQYTSYSSNYKQVLWISMHLHLELYRITREVNLIFGKQMTFLMAAYFLYLTMMCYFLSLMLKQEYQEKRSVNAFFSVTFMCILLLIRLFIMSYIFESIKSKANYVGKIIHHLTNGLRYADLYVEIYQFTLQTMQQPFKFIGIGFFNFGNEFLRKFCITIVTYVIIMVQLNIAIPENFLSRQNNKINSLCNLTL